MPPLVLPDDDLSDNLTNQECIGHARANGRGVLFGVFCLEKNICHGPAIHEPSVVSTVHWGEALTSSCSGIRH